MKEDITKSIVKEICEDFIDTVIVGLEECENRFPYTIACINCITELREKRINTDLNIFDMSIRDIIYREFSNYLAK